MGRIFGTTASDPNALVTRFFARAGIRLPPPSRALTSAHSTRARRISRPVHPANVLPGGPRRPPLEGLPLGKGSRNLQTDSPGARRGQLRTRRLRKTTGGRPSSSWGPERRGGLSGVGQVQRVPAAAASASPAPAVREPDDVPVGGDSPSSGRPPAGEGKPSARESRGSDHSPLGGDSPATLAEAREVLWPCPCTGLGDPGDRSTPLSRAHASSCPQKRPNQPPRRPASPAGHLRVGGGGVIPRGTNSPTTNRRPGRTCRV